ncbi:hypothetical protein B484DRAFT_114676 [Ochromonadaceae sp. CCMP2298]|nr:hypothetical protein B484DRAFT_114676 [Ochromonadaceae sp. CCMP2298]
MSLALAPVSIDSSGFLAHRGRSQSLAGVGASAGIGAGMGMGASVGSGTDTGTRSRSGTGESTPNSPEQSSAMARLRTLYQLDESPSLSDTKSPGGSADGVGGVGGAGGVEGGGAGDVGMGCVGGAGSVGVVDSPTEEDGGRSRMVSFSNLSDGDTVGSASEGTDLGTAAQRMLRSSFDSEEGGEMKLGGVGGTGEGKGNREAERVACYSPTSQCVGGGVGGVGGAGMGVGGMDGEEEDDQFKAEMTHLLLQVATRSHSEVRDSAGLVPPQHKRLALFAILGALYIRHSGAALTALAGLVGLLRLSDFFVGDLESLPVGLTMLDLVLEASCDRFDAESGDSPEQVLYMFIYPLLYYTLLYYTINVYEPPKLC